MTTPAQRFVAAQEKVRTTTRHILLSGAVLPALTALVAKIYLDLQGIPTMSLARAVVPTILLTLWALVPFLILTVVVRIWLPSHLHKKPDSARTSTWAVYGALTGVMVAAGTNIWSIVSHSGPGGFMEAVTMNFVLAMITLPILLIQCTVAACVGGLFGVFAARLGRRNGA